MNNALLCYTPALRIFEPTSKPLADLHLAVRVGITALLLKHWWRGDVLVIGGKPRSGKSHVLKRLAGSHRVLDCRPAALKFGVARRVDLGIPAQGPIFVDEADYLEPSELQALVRFAVFSGRRLVLAVQQRRQVANLCLAALSARRVGARVTVAEMAR